MQLRQFKVTTSKTHLNACHDAGRFVTLWDIMEKHFKPYAGIISQDLSYLAKFEASFRDAKTDDTISDKDIKDIRFIAEGLLNITEELGVRISAGKAATLSHVCLNTNNACEIRSRIRETRETMIQELFSIKFLPVQPACQKYLAHELFGENVKAHFHRASDDIEEAGKCLALGRGTACVFHLMRVTELAVKAIYKTLGVPFPRLADSWGKLLQPMDDQLAPNPPKGFNRHPAWDANRQFFDAVVNDLKSIKRVWRDTTMHVESDYSEEEAEEVFAAVRSFMSDVTTKLDQDGNLH